MRVINDYLQLEREFLNEKNLTIRGLCKRHDIKSYSTVARYARTHGWYERKARIKVRTEEKIIEKVSEAVSDADTDELLQFRSEALAVARATIYKYAAQLDDPLFRVSTGELVKVINSGLLILGEPTARTEERRLELSGTLTELPPEFLRRLVEASRPPQLESGRAERLVPPGAPGARQN